MELTVVRVAATLPPGKRPDSGGAGPGHVVSVNASEFAFLALGLILGVASGAALVEVLRARPPVPREVRVTVSPDAIPRRRGSTLAGEAFALALAGPVRYGPADDDDHEFASDHPDDRRRTAVPSPRPGPAPTLEPTYRMTNSGPAVARTLDATGGAMVGFRVEPGRDPVFQAMQDPGPASATAAPVTAGAAQSRGRAQAQGLDPAPAMIAVATAVAVLDAEENDVADAQDAGAAGSTGGDAPSLSAAVDGPCAEVRHVATERCELAVRARAGVGVADETLRAAQRAYDRHVARAEAAAAATDPAAVRRDKEAAQAAFRDARNIAGSADAVESAARDWLSEINRINTIVRDAGASVVKEREAAAAIAPSLERLALEADAARIKAETAEAACLAARQDVADCIEAQTAIDQAAHVPTPSEQGQRGPGTPGPRPAGPGPLELEGEPLAAALGAGQAPVIFLLLRGDSEAMARTVARLADDPAERHRWQTSLTELVEAIVAVSISQSALDFPIDHPFWGPFTREQDRDIVAALSSLGFRFDGLGGWVDERIPSQRDLSMAMGYAGMDPMRIRQWPTEAEMRDLFADVTVAADEHLAGAAGDLTLGELVAMLGRRADGLATLWNDWGHVRPLLLEDA